MRVVLVGTGAHMIENLLPAVRAIPDAHLVGVVSRDPGRAESFAARWDLPSAYPSIERLLDDGAPDLVIAAATPDAHVTVLRASAARGINSYIEKPPAASADVLQAVLPELVDSDGVATVGYNFRFSEIAQRLLEVIPSIGGARQARIAIRARKPLMPIWGFETAERSFLYAVGIHAVDLGVTLIPGARLVSATSTPLSGERFTMTMILTADDGRELSILVSTGTNRFEFDVDVSGVTGRVSMRNLSTIDLQLYDAGTSLGEKAHQHLELSGLNAGYLRTGYQRLLEHALTANRTSGSPTPVADSLPVLRTLDAACAELGF